MEAWQFIWGQTWESFSVYCMYMWVGVFIFQMCAHTVSTWVVWCSHGGVWDVLQMHCVGGGGWRGWCANKTAVMPDMPKPNKSSWKDAGRTQRAPKSKEKGEGENKGRRQSHIISCQIEAKSMDYSAERRLWPFQGKSWGFDLLNDGLGYCFPCLIDLEGAFICMTNAGSLMLSMDIVYV